MQKVEKAKEIIDERIGVLIILFLERKNMLKSTFILFQDAKLSPSSTSCAVYNCRSPTYGESFLKC